MVSNENRVAKKQKLIDGLFCLTNETGDEVFTNEKNQIMDEKPVTNEDKTVADEESKSVTKGDSNVESIVQIIQEVVENVCKKAEKL